MSARARAWRDADSWLQACYLRGAASYVRSRFSSGDILRAFLGFMP